jgi:hypothetical protein
MGVSYDPTEGVQNYVLAFESLMELRKLAICKNATLEKVEVTGVPVWFSRCLEMYVSGKGGDIHKRTVKTWFRAEETVYDWFEFAERNNVAVPADIDEFWKLK